MLGIATLALGFFLFTAVDTTAKFLTDGLHPFQIVWARQLGLVAGVVILLFMKGPKLLASNRPGLQVARGLMAAGSAALFIFAIRHVPLADAVAVSFVAPFLVTVLGALVLGEVVGIRRWIAVTIGFCGALIILRPGLGVVHPAAFLVVGAAGLFALRQIASRSLGNADPTTTTVAYTALVSAAVLTLPLPFVWEAPTWQQIQLLAVMAVLAAFAETLVIRAFELAQAVVLAPVHYTLLIWATIWGWLVFGQLPDGWTWIGAAIIVATGLYTLHRERLATQRKT